MKLSTKFCIALLCCLSSPVFAMSTQRRERQKEHYALRAEGDTLIIYGNNKIKKIEFDAPITALTSLETVPYVLVGFKNGKVILHNIKNKTLSTVFPSVHAVEITALYADETNFFTADAAGINYIWHNVWSNQLYGQRIRTQFPVINCEGTQDCFALQHTNRRIDYPKITLLARAPLKKGIVSTKTCYGIFKGFSDKNTLLIEQGNSLFAVQMHKQLPLPQMQ